MNQRFTLPKLKKWRTKAQPNRPTLVNGEIHPLCACAVPLGAPNAQLARFRRRSFVWHSSLTGERVKIPGKLRDIFFFFFVVVFLLARRKRLAGERVNERIGEQA